MFNSGQVAAYLCIHHLCWNWDQTLVDSKITKVPFRVDMKDGDLKNWLSRLNNANFCLILYEKYSKFSTNNLLILLCYPMTMIHLPSSSK